MYSCPYVPPSPGLVSVPLVRRKLFPLSERVGSDSQWSTWGKQHGFAEEELTTSASRGSCSLAATPGL